MSAVLFVGLALIAIAVGGTALAGISDLITAAVERRRSRP